MMNWKRYFRILLAAGILSLTTGIPAFAADETAAEAAAESAGLTEDETATEAEPQTSRVITLGEAAKEAEAAAEETSGDPEPAAEDTQDLITEETTAEVTENSAEDTTENAGLISLGIFKTTAYCPCYACSEGYGRHTCTGAIARANHTIAVDPCVIPYGSRVMINGTVYTAEDRGGGVKGKHIDIFYDTHAQSRQYGSRKAEVFLLT